MLAVVVAVELQLLVEVMVQVVQVAAVTAVKETAPTVAVAEVAQGLKMEILALLQANVAGMVVQAWLLLGTLFKNSFSLPNGVFYSHPKNVDEVYALE
jgi:hypothetical protein